MKRNLRFAIGVIAIATVGLIYFVRNGHEEPQGRPPSVGKPRIAVRQDDSTLKKANDAREREFHRISVKEFPEAEIAALLNGPENTPRHYIAAYLMTGSREFIEKAAEQFPSSPEVFYTMAVKTSDPQLRVQNLEKALSLDPNNSYLQLLLAGGLAANGSRGAAADLVKMAFEAKAFETFANPIKGAARELALKAGVGADEAAIVSLHGEPGVGPLELLSPLTKLYDSKEFKEAAGEDAESLAVSIAVKFQPLSKTNGIVAMLAHRTERMALQNLPGDAPYGSQGMTVAMRLAEIENESKHVVETIETLRRMPELSDNEWRVYIDKWSREGQMNALAWAAEILPKE
jgi:hypothetical protein